MPKSWDTGSHDLCRRSPGWRKRLPELRPLLARKGCGREDDSGIEACRCGTNVAGADRCAAARVYRWRKVSSRCIGHCLAADCPPCPITVACLRDHRTLMKPQMEQCEGAPIHHATLGKTPHRAWSR